MRRCLAIAGNDKQIIFAGVYESWMQRTLMPLLIILFALFQGKGKNIVGAID
jgi:hypothetical protein